MADTPGFAAAQQRHDEVSRIVRDARYRYYVLSDLAMPDAEFDALMAELEAIEAEFPVLRTPDSPTQQVGAPIDEAFPPFEHLEAMMSLDNVFGEADLRAWSERVVRGLGGSDATRGPASSRSTAPPSTACTATASSPWGPPGARARWARRSRSSS